MTSEEFVAWPSARLEGIVRALLEGGIPKDWLSVRDYAHKPDQTLLLGEEPLVSIELVTESTAGEWDGDVRTLGELHYTMGWRVRWH